MMISSYFFLLSRENDVGAIHRMEPDSLSSCLCFQVFRLNFVSNFFNLLLVRFHEAEIINYREAYYPRTQQRGLNGR